LPDILIIPYQCHPSLVVHTRVILWWNSLRYDMDVPEFE